MKTPALFNLVRTTSSIMTMRHVCWCCVFVIITNTDTISFCQFVWNNWLILILVIFLLASVIIANTDTITNPNPTTNTHFIILLYCIPIFWAALSALICPLITICFCQFVWNNWLIFILVIFASLEEDDWRLVCSFHVCFHGDSHFSADLLHYYSLLAGPCFRFCSAPTDLTESSLGPRQSVLGAWNA